MAEDGKEQNQNQRDNENECLVHGKVGKKVMQGVASTHECAVYVRGCFAASFKKNKKKRGEKTPTRRECVRSRWACFITCGWRHSRALFSLFLSLCPFGSLGLGSTRSAELGAHSHILHIAVTFAFRYLLVSVSLRAKSISFPSTAA